MHGKAWDLMFDSKQVLYIFKKAGWSSPKKLKKSINNRENFFTGLACLYWPLRVSLHFFVEWNRGFSNMMVMYQGFTTHWNSWKISDITFIAIAVTAFHHRLYYFQIDQKGPTTVELLWRSTQDQKRTDNSVYSVYWQQSKIILTYW